MESLLCYLLYKFFLKKISMLTFSGRIRDLSLLIVSPAVENVLSETGRWNKIYYIIGVRLIAFFGRAHSIAITNV